MRLEKIHTWIYLNNLGVVTPVLSGSLNSVSVLDGLQAFPALHCLWLTLLVIDPRPAGGGY